ncbi:MAG: trehalose-phosphatase [Candidatus Omnitrophota bacterium]|nr:MAG: trehalose-phosphatase [Candidatus Omnitrophota bacterium]
MKEFLFDAVVFDLDGVVTTTAAVHAKAWKEAFDEYLRLREKRDKEPFREFTHQEDYLPFVDGKPRYEGVKSFLESRNINIPFGDPDDGPDKETICGIGNKKNARFNQILDQEGAQVYSSTIELIKELKKKGVSVGVASSSKNCLRILQSAGIEDLFQSRVDGVVSVELGLKGKPEGDIFVKAAFNMGAAASKSIVVEDATSGVQAGRNGGFGLVLGIARKNNETELLENGADVVVSDLSEINIDWLAQWFHRKPRDLFNAWDKEQVVSKNPPIVNPFYGRSSKQAFFSDKKLVLFLDYDGTLTPIVDRPDLAVLSEDMRAVVKSVSQKHTTAIVSGRMREDVENLVGIKGLFYAGSHGFDIVGPGFSMVQPQAQKLIPLISKVIEYFKKELGNISGLLVEEKKFSVAVHYRLVDEEKYLAGIKKCVEEAVAKHDSLRLMHGKKVFEILPAIDWDKGKAIRWIMQALNINWADFSVVYIGDDTTDEDAFRMIRTRGAGVLVAKDPKESMADFQLSSPQEVKKLFEKILAS